MDSESLNARVACSGDIDEVVRLMHDAAAMPAAERPARDVADRPTFAETFVPRSELLSRVAATGIASAVAPHAEREFWARDALKGGRISVRHRCDGHMRAGVPAPR